METLSVEKLLELNHLDTEMARKMNLLTKCKFCKKTMIQHTQNDAWWHLIYVSQGKEYKEIYP